MCPLQISSPLTVCLPVPRAGSYQIEITQVAQAQSLAINVTAASADTALGKVGNLTFKIGEWSYSGTGVPTSFVVNGDKPAFAVAVELDDSLEDIALKINQQDQGVQASVLEIDGNFQLLVTAESGAKNAIEITADKCPVE